MGGGCSTLKSSASQLPLDEKQEYPRGHSLLNIEGTAGNGKIYLDEKDKAFYIPDRSENGTSQAYSVARGERNTEECFYFVQ